MKILRLLAASLILTAAHLPVGRADSVSRPATTRPAKVAAIAALETQCKQTDLYAAHHAQAARLFAGCFISYHARGLDWEEFPSEAARQHGVGGWPDTEANVWMRQGKAVYVETQRGMTSGIGWFELAHYYFRADGTLAKLVCSANVGSPRNLTKQILYYDARGRLLQSAEQRYGTVYMNEKAHQEHGIWRYGNVKPVPKVYRRVSRLPFYRLLRHAGPKRTDANKRPQILVLDGAAEIAH